MTVVLLGLILSSELQNISVGSSTSAAIDIILMESPSPLRALISTEDTAMIIPEDTTTIICTPDTTTAESAPHAQGYVSHLLHFPPFPLYCLLLSLYFPLDNLGDTGLTDGCPLG